MAYRRSDVLPDMEGVENTQSWYFAGRRCRLGAARIRCMAKKGIRMYKINSADFRVREASEVNLKNWATRIAPVYGNNDQYQEILQDHVKKLSAQQELLYASDRYAVLLIFQAMDAAGKDGVIAHVMSGVNPQGCQVFSFK